MEKPRPPVVEETGPYRPGQVIMSDSDYEKPKSGVSTSDSKDGKTKPQGK